MARVITDIEINELITPGDVIDAQDAGIIPDGTYTLQDNEVILQNREIYEWLRDVKKDPRFINTVIDNNPQPKPTLVDESENSPTYQVAADKSEVKGTISFLARDDGYSGQIVLTNFPEGYVKTSTVISSPIIEANYENLKVEALKLGQAELDNLKTNTVDFGILKIVGEEKNKLNTKGTIVDTSNNPIGGALIKDSTPNPSQAYSQVDGSFNFSCYYDEETKITLNITAEGYSQIIGKTPYRADGTILKDLGVIKLTPIKEEISDQIIENKTLTESQKKILEEDLPKDFISSMLKKILRSIQDRLIPSILRMVATFGITKFNEEVLNNINNLPKVCPSNVDGLNKIIDTKNKLTKQLNNLYKSINSINKFLEIPPITIDIAEKATLAAKIYVGVQSFIPSTVATPNPVGPVLIAKDLIEKLEDLIEVFKSKLGGGRIQLKLIIEELRKVLLLLNILDALIQSCAEEIEKTSQEQTIEQEQISKQLLKSTQQQSQQLSPIVTNVNGFKMSVVSIDNVTVGGLKRRQAIAQNKSDVIMLKGEPSFSSNDQILIDELVFYIQQNDLKAD